VSDNVYNNQRGIKTKADVVGNIAIPGFKIVLGDNDTDGGYLGSTGDKLFVIDFGYLNQIREGTIANRVYKKIRAHSHSVGLADQELSALGTAGFGNWPVAAAGVVLVSSSVADDTGGTGARSVTIRGLAETTWALQEVTVNLDGQTPTVATTEKFIRINEIEVATAGSGLTNAGDITASISGTNMIKIYAGHSTSDGGRYTIPAGSTGYFQNPNGSVIGNKEMTYHIFCRDAAVADSPFLLRDSWHSKDGGFRPSGLLEPFTEKCDVVFVAHAEIAGAKGSASIEGWVEV
jgi:hypothetical protein